MISSLSDRLLYLRRYVLWPTSYQKVPYLFPVKFNFLWWLSLSRILVRMDPHWFGSRDPDPHLSLKLGSGSALKPMRSTVLFRTLWVRNTGFGPRVKHFFSSVYSDSAHYCCTVPQDKTPFYASVMWYPVTSWQLTVLFCFQSSYPLMTLFIKIFSMLHSLSYSFLCGKSLFYVRPGGPPPDEPTPRVTLSLPAMFRGSTLGTVFPAAEKSASVQLNSLRGTKRTDKNECGRTKLIPDFGTIFTEEP